MNMFKRYCLVCVAGLLAAGVMAQSQHFHANIQNEAVSRYMSEVTYTTMEDSSRVAEFLESAAGERLDVPNPVFVQVPELLRSYLGNKTFSVRYWLDGTTDAEVTDTVFAKANSQGAPIYDVQPDVECYFNTYLFNNMIGSGTVTTEGPVRMIYLPTMRNVRDLGGWTTSDGRTIKYGKLIRGSELNGMHVASAADIRHLRILGVEAELDMRADYEDAHGVSAFGFKSAKQAGSDELATYLYTNSSGQLVEHLTSYSYLQRWRQEFNFIVSNLRAGRTIYFHCRWGADRTGYLALLLEGLLGVPYDGLIKDYELSAFATLDKKKEMIDPVIEVVCTYKGETLQEKFEDFWIKRVGVKQADVDFFIEEMLEGDGGEVVTSVEKIEESPVSTVTYDLMGRRVSPNHKGLVIRRQRLMWSKGVE